MNNKYFFISKPRCASTYIYEGLTNWNDKIHGNKQYYHITADNMKHIFKNKYNSSFSFAVIRHPYELVLSWYNEHKKDRYEEATKQFYNISLDDWIEKGCPTHWTHTSFNPLYQYKWICDNDDKLIVSYLIRMENFNNDINSVYEQINKFLPKNITIESIQNTRRNESNNNIVLNEKQKQQIYNLFKKDFELFNYKP